MPCDLWASSACSAPRKPSTICKNELTFGEPAFFSDHGVVSFPSTVERVGCLALAARVWVSCLRAASAADGERAPGYREMRSDKSRSASSLSPVYSSVEYRPRLAGMRQASPPGQLQTYLPAGPAGRRRSFNVRFDQQQNVSSEAYEMHGQRRVEARRTATRSSCQCLRDNAHKQEPGQCYSQDQHLTIPFGWHVIAGRLAARSPEYTGRSTSGIVGKVQCRSSRKMIQAIHGSSMPLWSLGYRP